MTKEKTSCEKISTIIKSIGLIKAGKMHNFEIKFDNGTSVQLRTDDVGWLAMTEMLEKLLGRDDYENFPLWGVEPEND